MTKKFDRLVNNILLELSQRLVNRANDANSELSDRNPYAKSRSDRFQKKTEDYAIKNNSLIRLREKNSTGTYSNFIIDSMTPNSTIKGIVLFCHRFDVGNSPDNKPISMRETIIFDANSGSFYNEDNKKEYTLVDKSDAMRFAKKVQHISNPPVNWKTLRFGGV